LPPVYFVKDCVQAVTFFFAPIGWQSIKNRIGFNVQLATARLTIFVPVSWQRRCC
jgi:hypothetical protein